MINKTCRKLLCVACISFAVLFLPVLFSCSNLAEEKSIASVLDQIDILINQNQFKDAERELDKISKKSYSSWTEIGIFRRYVQIQANAKAEKIILNSIKKNPKNDELNAVYTNFLLRNKRTEEALNAGKVLQGTKYGSIYSECVLRNVLEKSEKSELSKIFRSSEYFPIYYDAYVGSKNQDWLRNCALLRLSNGAYSEATLVAPEISEIFDSENGYFWALVMYDAQRYGDAINYGETAESFLNSVSGSSKNLVSFSKLSAILQDSYTWLGDSLSAEDIRKQFLDSITDYRGNYFLSEAELNNKENAEFLPAIFVNSAKWAKDSEEPARTVKLLSFCVKNWPDFVPGLIAYADFAYNSNIMRNEDLPKMQLRDEGLATLEMEQYDSRPKIPLSDALARIDDSLAKYKDPLLFIVRLDLRYKTESKLTETEKSADIWKVLEENMISPSVYPEILMEYALNFLLENKKFEDAWQLFYKYISAKYEIALDDNFWTNVVKKIYGFTSAEAEYAFYFATLSLRAVDSVRLGEYYVFENGTNGENNFISANASDKSAINLAMVYHSLGQSNNSLELYKKVNSRSSDRNLKSLVMYRMALIYLENNDEKNAKLCAEYSITLNSRNMEARLLLAKIKAKK